MKRNEVVGVLRVLFGVMMASAGVSSSGCAMHGSGSTIGLDGRLTCPFISTHGGTTFMQVMVTTPALRHRERRPVNLCVVLDRSGSMGTEGKMDQARAATIALINQLTGDDFFSLVIYDDVVEVACGPTRVRDRAFLRRIVQEVYPRGWTNLGGGMMEGFRQAERQACEGTVNRVILLSDGLANRGIVDPGELGRIACRYRGRGIGLSTMGMGWDFNENLMVQLANGGGGNYYFIESARDLASMFQREFECVVARVAGNASVELTLGSGVIVRDVVGYPFTVLGDVCTISLGDLYASERREITVELDIPPGRGTLLVATGKLFAESEFIASHGGPSFRGSIRYTGDCAEVERNRDLDAQARADVAVSTRLVDRALKALDEGKSEEAVQSIAAAREHIEASPSVKAGGAAADQIAEQKAKLDAYSSKLQEDKEKAKKTIQYDNYRTQRQR